MKIITFDPRSVGRAEVGWWMAHNVHDKSALYAGLVQHHSELYGLTAEEAKSVVGHMMVAVKGHDVRDWDLAISSMTSAYAVIKTAMEADFDPKAAAELEISWWRLHDELEFVEDKTPLAQAFTNLYALIFGVSAEKLMEAGRLKAEATHQHDLAEAEGVLPEDAERYWKEAEGCLVGFYTQLAYSIGL